MDSCSPRPSSRICLHEIHQLPGALVYGLVTVLVFGEAALFIGFILPGETAVLVAGVVASQDHVNVGVVCVLVVAAAITGDSVGYEVGHRYGESLMKLSILKRRRPALERALEGLRRRGPIYVFIGRFTAFLRAVMPGLAGMSGMNYRRFFIANALGGTIWGVTFTLARLLRRHGADADRELRQLGGSHRPDRDDPLLHHLSLREEEPRDQRRRHLRRRRLNATDSSSAASRRAATRRRSCAAVQRPCVGPCPRYQRPDVQFVAVPRRGGADLRRVGARGHARSSSRRSSDRRSDRLEVSR